jgi:hypothetical protein
VSRLIAPGRLWSSPNNAPLQYRPQFPQDVLQSASRDPAEGRILGNAETIVIRDRTTECPMLIAKGVVLAVLGVLSSGSFIDGQTPDAVPKRLDVPGDRVEVGQSEVCIPKGVFLLVRKGREYGAVRFTDFEPGETANTGGATYESYYQSDGSGSFLTAKAHKQSGRLFEKPPSGIGRFAFRRGHWKLPVGKWSFDYHFPGCVSMYPHNAAERDYGFEFAPTAIGAIADIDVRDQRIKWFRYELNRTLTLSLADLAK